MAVFFEARNSLLRSSPVAFNAALPSSSMFSTLSTSVREMADEISVSRVETLSLPVSMTTSPTWSMR